MGFKVTAVRDNVMDETTVDHPEHLEGLLELQEGLEPLAHLEQVGHPLLGVEHLQHQERHLPAETGEMLEFLWLVWEAAQAQEKRKSWVFRPHPRLL